MNNEKALFDISELETLARLYMAGRLTVLEERELEYVLARTGISTEVIDEARAVMRLTALMQQQPRAAVPERRRWLRGFSAAAAIVVAIVLAAVGLFVPVGDCRFDASEPYVAVYVHGKRVDAENAFEIAQRERERSMAMILAVQTESEAEQAECIELINQISQR